MLGAANASSCCTDSGLCGYTDDTDENKMMETVLGETPLDRSSTYLRHLDTSVSSVEHAELRCAATA
jgi:hypothetical protein